MLIKEKFGKVAHDLMVKDLTTDDSQKPNMQEMTDEMQKKFHEDLRLAVDHGRHAVSCDVYGKCNKEKCKPFIGDFFVEINTFKPRLFKNTIIQKILTRQSCPTPNYDQMVFRFNSKLERIEEIWVLGNRETCYYFLQNSKSLKPEFYQTFDYVRRFAEGELFRVCKEFNGEEDDSPELKNKNINFTIN